MKFKRSKDIVCTALITSLVFCTAPAAFAKVANTSIPVSFHNIKILINGKQLNTDKEPFIYNGTTYLPVRAVSEAVGKTVSWDGASKTVSLTDGSQPVAPSIPEKPSVSYSRQNPAPIGTTQRYSVNNKYGTSFTADFTVEKAYRGASAWSKIKAANMFNESAPSGKEYVLIKVKADVLSVKDDKSVNFYEFDFTPFSGTNTEYEHPSVVEPEPDFEGSVYAGGSLSGYIAFLVDKNDSSPKAVFGEDYDGTGGIWFAIG